MTYEKLGVISKAMLRGKCIAFKGMFKKKKRLKVSDTNTLSRNQKQNRKGNPKKIEGRK